MLRNAPQLAALLDQAVDTVGRFSYRLLPAQQAQQAGGVGAAEALRRRDRLLLVLRGGGGPAGALLRGGQARHAPRPHHLQRHRLQRGQRYGLGPCPSGVDPVLGAALFSRRLRAELLQLFVPQPAWHSVLDFAALEAEAAEAALEAAAGALAKPTGARFLSSAVASKPSQARQQSMAADGAPAPAPGDPAASPTAAAPEGLPYTPAARVPDTWIVPLVQAGFAGLRQDERCTLSLLAWATQQQHQQAHQDQQHRQQHQQPSAPLQQQPRVWPGGSSWRSWASAGSPCLDSDGSEGSGGRPAVLLQLASPYLNLARPLEWFLTQQASWVAAALGMGIPGSHPPRRSQSAGDGQCCCGWVPPGPPGPLASPPPCLLSSRLLHISPPPPSPTHTAEQAGSAEVELITSSPEANGFFGSKGVSGYVPLAYSLLEHRTWRRLNRRRAGSGGAAAWLAARGSEQRTWRRRRQRRGAVAGRGGRRGDCGQCLRGRGRAWGGAG